MDIVSVQNQLALTSWAPGSSAECSTGNIFLVETDTINISDTVDMQSLYRARSEPVRPRDLPLNYKSLLTDEWPTG